MAVDWADLEFHVGSKTLLIVKTLLLPVGKTLTVTTSGSNGIRHETTTTSITAYELGLTIARRTS
jgi:hypothetical protein